MIINVVISNTNDTYLKLRAYLHFYNFSLYMYKEILSFIDIIKIYQIKRKSNLLNIMLSKLLFYIFTEKLFYFI